MPHFGANRVAEEHELHRGNADHHRQREAVAPHLDELLPEHRPERATLIRSSFFCSAMNTSSIVGCPNCLQNLFRRSDADEMAATTGMRDARTATLRPCSASSRESSCPTSRARECASRTRAATRDRRLPSARRERAPAACAPSRTRARAAASTRRSTCPRADRDARADAARRASPRFARSRSSPHSPYTVA